MKMLIATTQGLSNFYQRTLTIARAIGLKLSTKDSFQFIYPSVRTTGNCFYLTVRVVVLGAICLQIFNSIQYIKQIINTLPFYK